MLLLHGEDIGIWFVQKEERSHRLNSSFLIDVRVPCAATND